MEPAEHRGLALTLQELIVLYQHFQKSVDGLTNQERDILRKIESTLYSSLTIERMEELNNPRGRSVSK